MKVAGIALLIWVLAVPCAVALFLIFAFIASLAPSLYCAALTLALTLAIFISIWGPLSFFQPSLRHPFRIRQQPD